VGNRQQQTAGGVTTTYLVNLEGGLNKVLSNGTSTYLYGLDRIAQTNGTDTQRRSPLV
jgi:hypothetical protein